MTDKAKAAGAQIILDDRMPTTIRRGSSTIEFNQSGGIIVRSDSPVTLRPAETLKPTAPFSSAASGKTDPASTKTAVVGVTTERPSQTQSLDDAIGVGSAAKIQGAAAANSGAGPGAPVMLPQTYNPTFMVPRDVISGRTKPSNSTGPMTSSISSAP